MQRLYYKKKNTENSNINKIRNYQTIFTNNLAKKVENYEKKELDRLKVKGETQWTYEHV